MNTIDDLIGLIRDQLGLPLGVEDATRSLHELAGWDSIHVLWLITTLERSAGHRISMPDLLAATSLQEIYDLAAAR